ncbi:MAG: GNAT family N-acetyltransferase [bacterium]
MDILLEICTKHNWKKLFFDLTEKMKIEKHLLPQIPENLLSQFANGLSAIALCEGEIIGHVTIWNIAENWYEIGTTYTDPRHRGHHINFSLYEKLLAKHADKNILETTTNQISIHVGEKLGFIPVKRNSLPTDAFHGTCICGNKKTGSSSPLTCCKLAWDGENWENFSDWSIPCHVRVTYQTFARNSCLQEIKSFASQKALVFT